MHVSVSGHAQGCFGNLSPVLRDGDLAWFEQVQNSISIFETAMYLCKSEGMYFDPDCQCPHLQQIVI